MGNFFTSTQIYNTKQLDREKFISFIHFFTRYPHRMKDNDCLSCLISVFVNVHIFLLILAFLQRSASGRSHVSQRTPCEVLHFYSAP